jgi:hypothetical protein
MAENDDHEHELSSFWWRWPMKKIWDWDLCKAWSIVTFKPNTP